MDPVSHLIFGRALSALTRRPPDARRGRTAAIVIGSIAPDVDALLMPTGWDRYLIWHERGTHALIGTAIDGLALGGLCWLTLRALDNYRTRHRRTSARTPAFVQLWLAAWLGCLGHITLDIVSGGTIRLFAPFALAPFSLPLTAMADPLLAVPLLLFFVTALIWKRRARTLAIGVFCVLAGVLAVKAVSEQAARTVYRDAMARDAVSRLHAPEPAADLRAVEARWGSFTRWMFYDRTAERLRAWSVDARAGTATRAVERRITPLPRAHDAASAASARSDTAALIAASRDLETVQHLFTLYDLIFVETHPRSDGTTDVRWSDLRFCWPADCGLWFGGTFDASGQTREQWVIIGGVRQARPR